MTDVAIAGVGLHEFGRFADKSSSDLAQDAIQLALDDAGLSLRDIQAAYLSAMYLPATSGVRVLKPMGASGIPICDVEAACASGAVALRQAALGIRAGAFDIALVVGVEKMGRGFMDPSMIYEDWQIAMGMDTNPSYWAMRARRHMHEYGTTELQIAKVAHKNHRNSVHNPYAMYRKEFTLEEILGSPLVCDPIRLFEICAPNDGAAAVVLCAKNGAGARSSRSIRLAACAHTISMYSADFRAPAEATSATLANPGPTEMSAREAYEEAGIGVDDIDCFEVQDTDAFCELEIYEQIGPVRARRERPSHRRRSDGDRRQASGQHERRHHLQGRAGGRVAPGSGMRDRVAAQG